MISVRGQSLLERQISTFNRNGLDNITLVVGHARDSFLSNTEKKIYNPYYANTNMVVSLLIGLKSLSIEEDVLVSYGDICFTDQNLRNLIDSGLEESDTDIHLAADKNWLNLWKQRMPNPLDDGESFQIGPHGMLQEIGKKITSELEAPAQFIGLYLIKQKSVESLLNLLNSMAIPTPTDSPIKDLYSTDLLNLLIEKGWNIEPTYISNGWIEIDTLSDIEVYESGTDFDWLGNV
jgi:hypothetical protein